jgi:hypothetical protein
MTVFGLSTIHPHLSKTITPAFFPFPLLELLEVETKLPGPFDSKHPDLKELDAEEAYWHQEYLEVVVLLEV